MSQEDESSPSIKVIPGTNNRFLEFDSLRHVTGEEVIKVTEEDGVGCGDGTCADVQYIQYTQGPAHFPRILIAAHIKPDESLGPILQVWGEPFKQMTGAERISAALEYVLARLQQLELKA